MRMALVLCLLASPAAAQILELNPQPGPLGIGPDAPDIQAQPGPKAAATASGGVVRVLDRVSGKVEDIDLANGESTTYGRLQIALGECRYPVEDPASDAYAYLTIRETGKDAPVFAGWMIASSPGLNAMDDARYDVWVLRCNKS